MIKILTGMKAKQLFGMAFARDDILIKKLATLHAKYSISLIK